MKHDEIPAALHGSIPELLRKLRLGSNYTQKDVGAHLNMTRQGYGCYERGERRMTLPMMSALADLYHVNLLDLITLELSDFGIQISDELRKKLDESYAREAVSQMERLLLDYYRGLPASFRNDINYFLTYRTGKHRAGEY